MKDPSCRSRPRLRRVLAALAVVGCLATLSISAGAASAAPRRASGRTGAPKVPIMEMLARQGHASRALFRDEFGRRMSGSRGRSAAARGAGTTAPTGGAPVATALNPATHTLYVVNSNDNTVSVIDAATCNAGATSGCGAAAPTVQVGSSPQAVAVNPATDTIYAANGNDGTVSVINGATCNAGNTSGCGQTPAIVTVGSMPLTMAVNQATDTVYVANFGNGAGTTISVIDGTTCNGQVQSGCGNSPASLTIGTAPDGVTVDRATDTVYAAASAPDGSQTVYVINGATCNAASTSGCNQVPPTIPIGNGGPPGGFAIDRATGTLYAVNNSDNTVSIINIAKCNGTVTTGCGQSPAAAVSIGSGAGGIAVDAVTRTAYVANIEDNTVSVFDVATCNALTTSGCGTHLMRTGRGPAWLTLDPATDTIYTPNQDDNTVSVLDGAVCNAVVTFGCTRFPPTVPVGNDPDGTAVNDDTHTVYVANSADGTVSIVDGAACNAHVTSGCKHSVATVTVGNDPTYLAVDQATDTIYVPNALDNTVSVIDGRTCNATITSGCALTPPTIAVRGTPALIDIDQATDSVYVGTAAGDLAVIDGNTCNSVVTSGCGQTPAMVKVSTFIGDVAVNQDTNTIYTASPFDNIVSVIDGTTCNAAVTTGCGQAPATMPDSGGAGAVDVDERTNTVYVANSQPFLFGETAPGTVWIFNGATCDATVTSGCNQTATTVPVGDAAFDIAVDQASNAVDVVNFGDDSVSVIDGTTCNAIVTWGCGRRLTVQVGGLPVAVGVSAATGTAYVANDGDAAVSVFRDDGVIAR